MDRLVGGNRRPVAIKMLMLGFAVAMAAEVMWPAAASAMTVDQHIRMLQSEIRPGQAVGHVALAQYLYDHYMYSRALTQVDAALSINPNNQNAILLKSLIAAKIKNGGEVGKTQAKNHSGKTTGGLLTPEDINRIRLAEWSVSEQHPMRGVILKRVKTLHAFWKQWIAPNPLYQSLNLTEVNYKNFLRLNNFARQASLMMRIGDPKFTKMIVVRNNPDAIRLFRTTIQPFVLQSCSTVGCHRGQDFHGFKLFGARTTPSMAQTYTNFYILSKYSYRGRKLIDRSNPYNSLLIQYLMPHKIAAVVHPGKKPLAYRSFNEKALLSWISSLAFPTPSYGIKYKMPVSKHAGQSH